VKIFQKNSKMRSVAIIFILTICFLSCKIRNRKHLIYNDPSVKNNPVYFVGILANGDTIYYPTFVEEDVFYKHNGRYLTYRKGGLVRDIGILDNKYEGVCFNYIDGKLDAVSMYHKNRLVYLYTQYKDGKINFINIYETPSKHRKIFYNPDMTIKKEELYRNDSLLLISEKK